MKKITLSLISALMFTAAAFAQVENPVKWSYTAKKVSDKVYDIYITANLDNKWHIYSQNAGEGPQATEVNFTKNPLVTLEGKTKEVGTLVKEYSTEFKSVLNFYSKTVSFVQRVKLRSPVSTNVKGTISYMVCDDKKCLPPKDIPFSVNVAGK